MSLRTLSDWDETRVAHGQPEWFENAGLSKWLRLDGDPAALKKIENRHGALKKLLENDEKQTDRGLKLSPTDKNLIGRQIRLLEYVLKKSFSGRKSMATVDSWVRSLRCPKSDTILAIAPIADVAADDADCLPESRNTLAQA